MSCVNINANLKELVEEKHRYSTPLKTLHLVECNINHEGLAAILSLPRALTDLDLSTSSGGCVCFSSHTRLVGESHDNTLHFEMDASPCHNYLFFDHAAETVAALKQQKHSLKQILYAGAVSESTSNYRSRQSADVIDGAFGDFLQLHKIRLVRPCVTLERAIMTTSPPPNLKILDYTSYLPFFDPSHNPLQFHGEDNSLDESSMRIPFFHIPNITVPPALHALIVTIEDHDEYESLESTSLRRFIQKSGQELLEQGVSLTVMASDATGYFPPYLFGEQAPQDVFVYTAFRGMGWLIDEYKVESTQDVRPGSSAVEEPEVPVVI
jgi:hypothetical protein